MPAHLPSLCKTLRSHLPKLEAEPSSEIQKALRENTLQMCTIECDGTLFHVLEEKHLNTEEIVEDTDKLEQDLFHKKGGG